MFQFKERVRVFTKFHSNQTKFWLPDIVLYFGESLNKGESIILWHGTLHSVNTKDIFKLNNGEQDEN